MDFGNSSIRGIDDIQIDSMGAWMHDSKQDRSFSISFDNAVLRLRLRMD